MEILTFDNADDMYAALEEHAKHAMDNLHVVQRNIKQGDHWIRFVDVGMNPPLIEFGRVLTADEIASSMLDDGVPFDEVTEFISDKERLLKERGLMWGVASSLLDQNQLGSTHVSFVWPIEERLYDWAEVVGYDVSAVISPTLAQDMDIIDSAAARLLIEIAYRQIRAHYLPQKEES